MQIPQELMGIQALLGSVPGHCPCWGFCNGTQGSDRATPLLREMSSQEKGSFSKGSTAALVCPGSC